jgi:hypothetical protein
MYGVAFQRGAQQHFGFAQSSPRAEQQREITAIAPDRWIIRAEDRNVYGKSGSETFLGLSKPADILKQKAEIADASG